MRWPRRHTAIWAERVVSRIKGSDRKGLNCNMVALAGRPCVPCRGGVEPLTPDECARYLTELPDWELRKDGRYLARRFRFPDYRTALALANAVSALAEETWHRPELAVGLGFCQLSFPTRNTRRPPPSPSPLAPPPPPP